jgi:hypothetical protein
VIGKKKVREMSENDGTDCPSGIMKRDSEKISLLDGREEREEKESAIKANARRDVAERKEPGFE